MRSLFPYLGFALALLFNLTSGFGWSDLLRTPTGAAAVADADAAGGLRSLPPGEILTKLDLSRPGLEAVRRARDAGDRSGALRALLAYYRNKFPLAEPEEKADPAGYREANRVVDHVLQWGPYEPADYGEDVNWEWDPRGDIEWVAAVYRFYWARPLADAYQATRDEKYVRAFVELAADWIAKHPLEKRDRRHPVYTSWRGFPWLDIQTGIRADNLCKVFPVVVHGQSFTPEFLGILLASLYDHQVKTEQLPMNAVHNKAVFEQRGFVNVAYTFKEFADSDRWLRLALKRTRENFLAQTTPDGVQREWSFGYNVAVLRDAVDIMGRMEARDIPIPDDYRERVRKMYDYLFAIATPELAGPMFGDASRSASPGSERSRWQLYSTLVEASALLGDEKYAARARLDLARLPEQTSYAFPAAGIYVLRDRWGPEQIYFALHCSPKGISGHDQPDNGTFELSAFGRWLMPDTGFYTYGHDPDGRRWHRRTSVHQTLTLDGKDAAIAGKHLLWKSTPGADVVCVENASYPDLSHRRTVWFVDRAFFVLLDEALGEAPGKLDLHFQLAPGSVPLDTGAHRAVTTFDDANVLVWAAPDALLQMEPEEGWFARKYGHRTPRTAFRFRHSRSAPAAFLTIVCPFRGSQPPRVEATLSEPWEVGADPVELQVEARGRRWRLGRDLKRREAWCRAKAPFP